MGLFDSSGVLCYDYQVLKHAGLMTQFNPQKNYYVYHLINPVTNQVFYVGKGTRTRCYQHLKDTLETAKNKRLWGYINNLREEGHEPMIIKIKEKLDEESAYDLEDLEVQKYGRKGYEENGILMNIVLGGYRAPTKFGEDNGFYGKSHTEETKRKISEANTGRKNPKNETAKENSKAAALEYWSTENEETQNRKKQLGVEGKKYWEGSPEEIEEKKRKLRELYEKKYKIVYPDGTEEIIVNLKQACIDKGFNHSSVYKVLQGKRSHHKGCKFYKIQD